MRGIALVVLIAGLCFGLTACDVPSKPAAQPSPPTSSSQKYQSQSEALSAARAVYEHYLEAADSIAAGGGQSVEPLVSYVTSAELKQEQDSANDLAQRKLRIVGSSKLIKFTYQNADLKLGSVNAYTCVDFSKARVLNAAGKDVTPSKRANRQTSVAKFIWQDDRLRLGEISPWSGDPIC